MEPLTNSITIAVAAYQGINPFHLSIPHTVFSNVLNQDGSPRFRVITCALEENQIETSMGFTITTQYGLEGFQQADIIIVPSWHRIDIAPPEEFIDVLKQANRRGVKIVGLCLGAFVLAKAGLLNGKAATTHWKWANAFSLRYPEVELRAAELYIDEGNLLTSAGMAAAIDCCLHMLRQICGAEIANQVARQMVVAPHRQGGQAQFIEIPLPVSRQDDRISQVLNWAAQHPELPHSIDSLAQKGALSRRTFTRHVRQTTGTTVMQWLLNQRIAKAQRMLESGTHSMEKVAEESGFNTVASLRQHFTKALNISPSSYRKQFKIKAEQSGNK
ncbi:MAG: GlxA family transcriptional regulator [Limnobaculum xujianqingii]